VSDSRSGGALRRRSKALKNIAIRLQRMSEKAWEAAKGVEDQDGVEKVQGCNVRMNAFNF